jgi:hypothetical protein
VITNLSRAKEELERSAAAQRKLSHKLDRDLLLLFPCVQVITNLSRAKGKLKRSAAQTPTVCSIHLTSDLLLLLAVTQTASFQTTEQGQAGAGTQHRASSTVYCNHLL